VPTLRGHLDRLLRHRLLAVASGAALALTTCTGGAIQDHGTTAATTAASQGAVTTPTPVTTPATVPALDLDAVAPAPQPAPSPAQVEPDDEDLPLRHLAGRPPAEPPAELPEEVELVRPSVVARADAALDPEKVAASLPDGVRGALVTTVELQAVSPRGQEDTLSALAVDIDDFRGFTPDVTAQNVGVWERLRDGDVVVRHDVAHELELELGGTITLRSDHGTVPARVGAFAANGAPPLADVLIPVALGDLLGAGAADTLIVGGDHDATTLADALVAALPVDTEVLEAPTRRQTQPKRTGNVTLEPFSFTSRGDGTIAVDPAWEARNIVRVEIPGLGATRCHRVMVPQLMAALEEVHEAGLYGHFDPSQFDGCYMPRHILWDPTRGLSMHAWGLAIDFNSRDNAFGARPQMDPRIVAIFEKWGFSWGGWWSTPDGMHFELKHVMDVG
jgi:hypothetical protein